MKSTLYPILLVFLLILSCNSSTIKEEPVTYISGNPKNIDTSDYKKIIALFKVEEVDSVPSYLGGLNPKYEMAYFSTHQLNGDCLNRNNLNPINDMCEFCKNLVIKKDGEYIILKTDDDLKRTFAPIESEEEALSYVSIMTGTYPRYNFSKNKDFKYLVKQFNRTYALKQTGGYETVTFDYDIFCCPPHKHYINHCFVDYLGNIKVLDRHAIYIDPYDKNCID